MKKSQRSRGESRNQKKIATRKTEKKTALSVARSRGKKSHSPLQGLGKGLEVYRHAVGDADVCAHAVGDADAHMPSAMPMLSLGKENPLHNAA